MGRMGGEVNTFPETSDIIASNRHPGERDCVAIQKTNVIPAEAGIRVVNQPLKSCLRPGSRPPPG